MKQDSNGNLIFQYNDLVELMYHGDIDMIHQLSVEHTAEVDQFNLINDGKLTIASEESNNDKWLFKFDMSFDIEEYCLSRCISESDRCRVLYEFKYYRQLNLIGVLYLLKHIVDIMRDNNVLWGVGRGSSVSSYVLFLLGVHKIDSIKYELDFHEFLR